jgi:outer membrane lipoprotein SlyB
MTSRSYFRQTKALWTAVLLASVTACTNIKNDSDRTRTEGAVTGAAAGAALGAGAGALLKKTPGGAAAGAAAGALVGGVAGEAYGNSVARKKEGYAAKESALDSEISGLQHQVAARRAYNEKLRSLIADKQKQLATVLASDRSVGPTVVEFDLRTSILTKLEEIDREAKSWQETIDAHKAVLKKSADDPHNADLQKAVDDLTEQRSELLRQRADLAGINDKLKK